ncbi:hypothetical protein LptCag_0882 [Leptospirillum ferriphilum]|uniref:Uncharacterized protein n=1 Tax=Leptospirillum ferriphilum TaxID=178606 RepID=A0A094WBL5_9BACT|nr:hypothetical protein LptCag_0882 [Leptospirillum ferriphilum]
MSSGFDLVCPLRVGSSCLKRIFFQKRYFSNRPSGLFLCETPQ